jgi:hypothetical protein
MRFELLGMASLALVVVACGGNVVVDHGSGNGGFGGHGGHGTGNGDPGPGPGVGGSTADVQPVGPSSATVGGSTNTGMGTGGTMVSVGVTTTGSGNVTCQSGTCAISSDGSCKCQGKCSNGDHVIVSCGTDPGINCACFKNGQFVGNCQPSGAPNCEPDQSCCKMFF